MSAIGNLKNLAKKAEKETTNKKPKSITIDLEPIKEIEDQWVKNRAVLKEAEAKKSSLEKAIVEHVEPKWLEGCRANGEALNSCSVGRIKVNFKGKSQFLTPSTVDPDRLQQVMGEEEFDNYFVEKESKLQLTDEAISNEKVVEKLVEVVGQLSEEFGIQILEFKSKYVPKDALFNDFVMRSDKHNELRSKLEAAGAKRTKPTFLF